MRVIVITAALVSFALASQGTAVAEPTRTLDGSGNNLAHPDWGRANTQYLRVAPPNYADGLGEMVSAPSARYISNRVFNDVGQNLFSENSVSQWGWTWGQFLDHDLGLRDQTPAEHAPIGFDAGDPLERFSNDFGAIGFSRTPAAPGTGGSSPRQQLNTISSFIDASNVYGVSEQRLEWLREGPVDGDLANNGARLLLPGDYLPRADARGNPATAPSMDLMGALAASPSKAAVAGDVRANENVALTTTQTLLAREHNRVVDSLPGTLSEQQKFDVARRIVGAEVQYITYNEFLPAMGVKLPSYRGYDPSVDPGLSNEFAVVGYRAHSMIHGEFDVGAAPGTYTSAQIDAFRAAGITVDETADGVALTIPLNVAFGNPDLANQVGLREMTAALSRELEYRNDEQIDDSLRSVLFQVPKPGIPDPSVCGLPVVNPDCFTGVQDLGAIDIERGRDHGMPSYNSLRRAYKLPARGSFAAITHDSERFRSDPEVDPVHPIDDPDILDFVKLFDRDRKPVALGSDEATEAAVTGRRRSTLAARLRAVYGDVNGLDAFTGMVSEPHKRRSEFGELQLAIWKKQFSDLRAGDRFFYLNDPELATIEQQYGISYRHTLAGLIRRNTAASVANAAFKVPPSSG